MNSKITSRNNVIHVYYDKYYVILLNDVIMITTEDINVSRTNFFPLMNKSYFLAKNYGHRAVNVYDVFRHLSRN